jgi:ABC-2 type transport system permease protein
MSRLIRTELLKQRSLRTFVVGSVLGPAVAVLATVAIFTAAGRNGNDPLRSDTLTHAVGAPVGVVTIIALLLGILGMAGEYRHETITTTFLAIPRRRDVVVAKLAAHAIGGAAIGAAAVAIPAAIAIPWLRSRGIAVEIDGDLLRVAAGGIVSAALYGALGVSVGAVIKNQTVACATVLVWLLAIEGIVGDVFAGAAFVEWLPSAAARALVHVGPRGDVLSLPLAAFAFAAYVAGFAAAAIHSTLQRDVV